MTFVRASLRSRLAATGLALLVLAVGLAATGGVVRAVLSWQEHEAELVVAERAGIARWSISTAVQRYTATAEQMAAAIGADQDFTAADLDLLAAPVPDQKLAGIAGLALAVPADDSEVDEVQTYWRSQGSDGLTLEPATEVQDHAFTVANVTLDGGSTVLGRDLMQAQVLREALVRAAETGETTVTAPYILLRDRGLPQSQQQLSVAVVAPVPSADGQAGDRGWLLLGLRVQDMASAVLPDTVQGLADVTVTAAGSEGAGSTALADVTAGEAWSQGPTYDVSLWVEQQRWVLHLQATAALARTVHEGGLVPAVVLSGLLITAGILLLLERLLRARRRALESAQAADAGRRRAEHDSERGAGLLTAVLESIGDGVGVADRSGRIVLQNRAARAILGVVEDDGGPQTWQARYGVFLPDGVTPFPVEQMPLVRALAGERTDLVDMFIRNRARPDGVMISVSGRPLTLPGAGPDERGAVAVFHDVTSRRRLEASLRAEHDRYQRLLQAVSDLGEGVLVTSGSSIVYANQAYARLLGYTVPELLDLPSASILAGDEEAVSIFTESLGRVDADHRPPTLVTRLRHRDGGLVPVEAAALHVPAGQDGQSEQRVYIVRDLSERRRWEMDLAERAQELQEANRQLVRAREEAEAASQAKSDFLQSMSHEIRTPLNGVLGFTALLAQTPRHADAGQWARAADDAGRVLLDLVNNGLDLAKIEAGRITLEELDVDLAQLAREAVLPSRLTAERAGVDLVVRTEPGAPVLRRGDPTRLRQVMTNLVSNAVKFTPGGSVTLTVAGNRTHARLSVTDTGIGMTAQQQEQLFTRFQQAAADTTRRYGGTGLGLFITHGLVEAMQGSISVSSTAGGGSTFTVVLPLPVAAPTGPKPQDPVRRIPRQATPGRAGKEPDSPKGTDPDGPKGTDPDGPKGTDPDGPKGTDPDSVAGPGDTRGPEETDQLIRGLRVLVAEDNPTNQLVAKAMLQSRGLVVDLVENGEQAVSAALTGDYSAVFMDCRMPVMDGFEATRQIRAAAPGKPLRIIAMTANAFEDDRQACLAAGMDDFLPKPWKTSQLTVVLERLATLASAIDERVLPGRAERS